MSLTYPIYSSENVMSQYTLMADNILDFSLYNFQSIFLFSIFTS